MQVLKYFVAQSAERYAGDQFDPGSNLELVISNHVIFVSFFLSTPPFRILGKSLLNHD
jgi:hypothetical protein